MKAPTGLLSVAAALCVAVAVPALAQDVQAGISAWQSGNHEEAVRIWRPLAERGNADAQFNLAQAYRLGRGVPQNNTLSEQYYERAAQQGHEQAQANLGLILFQNNRRREAMPWIERAADRGDPRAQYVLGTALFNGDVVARDLPRAYAYIRRAADQGLPPARTQLEEMNRHVPEADRARGTELARVLAQRETRVAVNDAAPPPPRATARPAQPPLQPAPPARPPVQTAERPLPSPPRAQPPVATPAASGRWRVQLGAFSSAENARRAWAQARRVGALASLQPSMGRAGSLTRLQAGPLRDRAAADRACAAARTSGLSCFPVAP